MNFFAKSSKLMYQKGKRNFSF